MPKNERERLTDSEYEDCYAEALRILHYKYESVGVPYHNDKGERTCRIESLHADDHTVFLLAFGSDVANQIEHGKPVDIRSRSAAGRS